MSTCDVGNLYVNNDIPVEVTGLHYVDVSPYTAVIDATVVLNIYDPTPTLLAGPLALTYNATNDAYEGLVPAATAFVVGTAYTFIFTITFASGRINVMELQNTLIAETRQG